MIAIQLKISLAQCNCFDHLACFVLMMLLLTLPPSVLSLSSRCGVPVQLVSVFISIVFVIIEART